MRILMEFAGIRIRMCLRGNTRSLLPFRQSVLERLEFAICRSAFIGSGVKGRQQQMFYWTFGLIQQARYASLCNLLCKFDREESRVRLQEFRSVLPDCAQRGKGLRRLTFSQLKVGQPKPGPLIS